MTLPALLGLAVWAGASSWKAPAVPYPPRAPVIHSREEWLDARYGCEHLAQADKDDAEILDDYAPRARVAVHHTAKRATSADLAARGGDALLRAKRELCRIRRAHMDPKPSDPEPWPDIGYHFAIDWRGDIWQARRLEKAGTNVAGDNYGTLGVVLFGDFEKQDPTPAQLAALQKLLAYLVYAYKIPPDSVWGHHDINSHPTACPGRRLERPREYREAYVEAKASPLRRIRESLRPEWARLCAQAGGGEPAGLCPARPHVTARIQVSAPSFETSP